MNINMVLETDRWVAMRSAAFCYTLASKVLVRLARILTKRHSTIPLIPRILITYLSAILDES